MQIFTRVEVSRFRSIREATLENLGEYSALAGLNNSGKSNFLRAIHLFFTGTPEPGVDFNVNRDYYRPEVRSKKKKAIEVELTFALPDNFHFRKGLEQVRALLGGDFAIRKRWTRNQPQPDVFLNEAPEPLTTDDALKIEQFLALISLRYIPNRVLPTEVIAENEEGIRDMLVRRLGAYKKQSATVLGGIQETAQTVIEDVADATGRMIPDVTGVRLDTAQSLADLAFRFGYRLGEGDVEMDDDEQGSGTQSLLMFQTLHLIDRDFFQRFGWKQGAIWLVEEPESSLHTSLEAGVARFIASVSQDPSGRLQTVATTHSDLMVQYASSAYVVEKHPVPRTSWRASMATKQRVAQLLAQMARSGISRWVNPVLYYHLEPLILVEGKTDETFILRGLRMLSGEEYRVASLASLLGQPPKGGIETLREFVQDNADAIKTRAPTAAVIVVLDWDASVKESSFRKPFSTKDPFDVMVWPEADANPSLDASFTGIERFLPDRLISQVEEADPTLVGRTQAGQWTVHPKKYEAVKRILGNLVAATDLTEADLVHAVPFLEAIRVRVGDAVIQ